MWHFANAFDDGEAVVVDMPTWRSFDVDAAGGNVSIKRLPPRPHHRPNAFDDLDDHVSEFPRVDDRYLGRRQHAFTTSAWSGDGTLDGDFYDMLLRVEPDTGKVDAHRFAAGRGIGEAIFAPRDGGEPGDGYVLTSLFAPGEPTTDLLVLDAGDVAAERRDRAPPVPGTDRTARQLGRGHVATLSRAAARPGRYLAGSGGGLTSRPSASRDSGDQPASSP